MKSGAIQYEHAGGVNFQDSVRLTVRVETISLDGELKVRVLSESHTDPPHVINNNVITVDETATVVISDQDLQVREALCSMNQPCSARCLQGASKNIDANKDNFSPIYRSGERLLTLQSERRFVASRGRCRTRRRSRSRSSTPSRTTRSSACS